jgi:biopolymer transport protein TolQ
VSIDSSFLTYFLNASIVVKLVMLLLLTASVLSWTCILQKMFYLKDIHKLTSEFEKTFWSGGDLAKLYTNSSRNRENLQGIEVVFHSGFKEFVRLQNKIGVSAEAAIESVKRAMRGAMMREQDKLEIHLPFLATVGSTSPYVGLFGTVWGIMMSFTALAHVQQATISMVAPGIAEALIATAMGLFAAIPAVIAYNRYMTDINRLLNRFDVFQDEFENILFRQTKQNISQSELATSVE